MKPGTEIYNELKSLSNLLAEMDKTNVFTVPEGYFDHFTASIQELINPGENFLSTIPKVSPGTVPEGYFDQLPGSILLRIKSEEDMSALAEIKQVSPLLASLQKENVFDVPSWYFSSLADQVMDKVHPQPAKVAVMRRRGFVWRSAAAAVTTGVIAISALFVFNNPSTKDTGISNAINSSSILKESGNYRSEQQINAGIDQLSDDDIIGYLVKTGSEADKTTLLNSVDETTLPSQTEYLSDEKTLDNYLNQVNDSAAK